MDDVIMTLSWPLGRPTIAEAARALSLDPSRLDDRFGVQVIDRRENVYAVRCADAGCGQRAYEAEQGPFANPAIGVFGDLVD